MNIVHQRFLVFAGRGSAHASRCRADARGVAAATALACASLLSGCETMSALSGSMNGRDAPQINGGAIDVRYWDAEKRSFTTTFFDSESCDETQQRCVKPPRNIVATNDSVSMRVLRAYICNVPETAGAFSEFDSVSREKDSKSLKCVSDKDVHFSTRGEVAVLAKVAERKTGAGVVYKQGEIAPSDARLIYYSEDIRETGQPPNFANVPLYGPVTYQGNPILVQMHVVELDDAESEAQRSLLTSLAKLGSAAYPPSSSALAVLDKVGTAFLAGQQDDLMFDFLVEFDAGQSNGGRSTADLSLPLAEGIYAFVRSGDRNASVPWDQLELDHRSGMLNCRLPINAGDLEKLEAAGCGRLKDTRSPDGNGGYFDSDELRAAMTYFVVEVRRNELAGSNDGFQRFDQLTAPRSYNATAMQLSRDMVSATSGFVSDTLFDQARSEAKNLYAQSPMVRARARLAYAAALCSGLTDAGGTILHPGKRLSTNDVFYLIGLAEEHYPSDAKTQMLDASPTTLWGKCAPTLDASVAQFFEVQRATDAAANIATAATD